MVFLADYFNFSILVTFAAVAIFGYAWLVPVIVWGVLTWRGNTSGYSFLEIICVYGYSLSIFIPISVCTVRRGRSFS